MLSKNKQKYVRSLALKKHRDAQGVFIAEGPKVVGDLLPLLPCVLLCATPQYLAAHPAVQAEEVEEVDERTLAQISQLTTAHEVLAVFRRPQPTTADLVALARTQLCLALDGVQDPGNVGTMVRIADWFGIEHLFCSRDTADVFSPKTVQATMGAIGRVQVHQVDLAEWVKGLPQDVPVYATTLEGRNLYTEALTPTGVVVMGNEGRGISAEVLNQVNRQLFIPNYPAERATSESLNVAIATAIVCGEFRRRLA